MLRSDLPSRELLASKKKNVRQRRFPKKVSAAKRTALGSPAHAVNDRFGGEDPGQTRLARRTYAPRMHENAMHDSDLQNQRNT